MGFIILIVSGSHTISVSWFLSYYIFGFCFVKLFVLIMAVIEGDQGRNAAVVTCKQRLWKLKRFTWWKNTIKMSHVRQWFVGCCAHQAEVRDVVTWALWLVRRPMDQLCAWEIPWTLCVVVSEKPCPAGKKHCRPFLIACFTISPGCREKDFTISDS